VSDKLPEPEAGRQTESITACWRDGISGEQAAKVADIEPIGRGQLDPAAGKISAIHHLLAILRQCQLVGPGKLKWQPTSVFGAAGDSESRAQLITDGRRHGVALVLRIGEVATELMRVASEESLQFLKCRYKANGILPRRAECVAGEQPSEVDHFELVAQVLGVDLQSHRALFPPVEISSH